MSLDTIPIGDAVQQLDVGPLSFIPLLGVAASLLPYPKRIPLDIVNGDAVLVSIHCVTPQNACISLEPCPSTGMRGFVRPSFSSPPGVIEGVPHPLTLKHILEPIHQSENDIAGIQHPRQTIQMLSGSQQETSAESVYNRLRQC